ncbi:MAG TPA: kynureninase [Chloroflexota bacterium]|nr:kynureninase [Chloroflexota bacterium]
MTRAAATPDLAELDGLDSRDPLASLRDRFYIPSGTLYFDGNSLGLLSREAEQAVLEALDAWRRLAIDGWTGAERPWFHLGEKLGAAQAELVGAGPNEVVVTGGITINLHALLATFFQPGDGRTCIVADALNFPSDLYALQSHLRLRGLDPSEHLVLVPSRDGRTIDEQDVLAALERPDVALAWLPSVLYRSGQLLDMPRIAAAARARQITIGFDCAHSVGCVPHRLHDWEVDFAVWCTYKYLNAGPGSVGSLYVHERYHGLGPGLAGWWGSDKQRQFDMAPTLIPATTAGAWQIGTPSVLGAAALYGSLRVLGEAGLAQVRAKSLALTSLLIDLADRYLAPLGFEVGTPREAQRRGGHVALEHPSAVRITRALKARGIVPDFRPPNIIRLAPVPLYTRYRDVGDVIVALRSIVESGEHLQFADERAEVA